MKLLADTLGATSSSNLPPNVHASIPLRLAAGRACAAWGDRCQCPSHSAAALVLGGVDKLLDRVEGITFYYGTHIEPSPDKTPWSKSFGLEFSFHVGESGAKRRPPDTASPQKPEPEHEETGFTVKTRGNIVGNDSIVRVGVDTERVFVKRKPKVERELDYDLGIAYGQLDGIQMTEPYEVRGYVRELPALTVCHVPPIYQCASWAGVLRWGSTGRHLASRRADVRAREYRCPDCDSNCSHLRGGGFRSGLNSLLDRVQLCI